MQHFWRRNRIFARLRRFRNGFSFFDHFLTIISCHCASCVIISTCARKNYSHAVFGAKRVSCRFYSKLRHFLVRTALHALNMIFSARITQPNSENGCETVVNDSVAMATLLAPKSHCDRLHRPDIDDERRVADRIKTSFNKQLVPVRLSAGEKINDCNPSVECNRGARLRNDCATTPLSNARRWL